MPDAKRDAFLRRMIAEDTSDEDIIATLKVYDSRQSQAKQPAAPMPGAPSEWGQGFGRAIFGSMADVVGPSILEQAGQGMIGVLKGVGHTAKRLGDVVGKIPGVSSVQEAISGARPGGMQELSQELDQTLTPQGTEQKIGYGGEQAAEFLIPGATAEKTAAGIASRLAPRFVNAPRLVQAGARTIPRMATEAASAAGVAGAQGGDPTTAAAIGAVAPLASGVVSLAAPTLEQAAAKQVAQFLGPTSYRYKAMAARLTPKILERGIRGGREGVLEQAVNAAEVAGQKIDDALQGFGKRQVDPSEIVDALETAKDAFRTTKQMTLKDAIKGGHVNKPGATISGNMVSVPIVFEPRAVKQLDNLQGIIRKFGPDANIDQMVAIRRAWDDVVSQAGGFQHRAPGGIGVPLKDSTEAWAKREGAGAIRKLLDAEVPELTALNKEFSFWKNLNDVLRQTQQRTTPQGPGLTRELAGVAGAAAGSSHGFGPAMALGKIGKIANAVFTSPRWRLASAQAKDALAKAIMSGDTGQVVAALSRITAGQSSQVAPSGSR